MNKKKWLLGLVMGLLMLDISFAGWANAALINRGTDSVGNRLIYDSDLNITWYDYTNISDTWQNQMSWASGLTVNFNGIIFDDWRLPSTNDGSFVFGYDGTTTGGYNITSSEMGYLFYVELGNSGDYDTSGNYQPNGGLTNTGDFQNLQSYDYWSGTEYSTNPDKAWLFHTSRGILYPYEKGINYDGLAVRSGNIITPEPATMLLFSTGIVGLATITKIRRRK